MLTRFLCVLLAASVAVTSLPPPADAQFGIRRAFKSVVRTPARILPPVIGGAILLGGPFRKAFGVVAAVAVGVVIFDLLSRHERREVARRARVVVGKDPDQRVSDTYTSKDGTKQVTIVAEPTQKAADLKNDPAILVVNDRVVAPEGTAKAGAPNGFAADATGGGSPGGGSTATDAPPSASPPADAKPAPPAVKPVADGELVRINEIPPDTQCRKVTTQLELRKKKGQADAESTTNTAIFCQTSPGEWKPAST